MTNVILKIPSR